MTIEKEVAAICATSFSRTRCFYFYFLVFPKIKYLTVSFDEMVEAGYDLADADSDIDRIFEEKDEIKRRKSMLKTLKKALQTLTPIQKQTVYKLFVKNMSQAEIACEEGVTRWSINDRVEGILHRLRKILEKKENFFEKTPPQALENSLISEGT